MGYKLWLTIALVIIIILFLASIIEYIPSNNGEPGRLSIVWQKNIKTTIPCTGELTVSSQNIDNGRCQFQADLTMKNCEGKKYYVFEGDSCSGTYICSREIGEPKSPWKCTWEVNNGPYTFTLCADSDVKARTSVTC